MHPDQSLASSARLAMLSGGLMCLVSMACIQFGAALSAPAIAEFGPAGTAWLRLSIAGLVLIAGVRPPLLTYSRTQWRNAVVFGIAIACMTMSFFEAMRHIPLSLVVAIDFLGPLSVAALAYGLSWRLVWPVLALGGVILLAYDGQDWVGNWRGVLFATGSAIGWAAYILFTKKIGSTFKGMEGLAISLFVAGLVATPFGLASGAAHIQLDGLLMILGLAILVPLLPYMLELLALRRMPQAAFSILMSLEPALGALAGFLVLQQPITLGQMLGVALVVLASGGATLL